MWCLPSQAKESPCEAQDPPASVAGEVNGNDAFDAWLRESLFAHFGDITNEPIPEDLLRMIEEDRAERDRLRARRRKGG